MAWTGLPAAAGDDWADPAFIGQFVLALRERQLVLGQGLEPLPQAGAEISFAQTACTSAYLNLGRIQKWVEDNCTSFVPPVSIDGEASWDYFDLAGLRTAAGLNASGFTRVWPGGSGFGLAADGDYVGPWIFNELAAALNQLVWTVRSVASADKEGRRLDGQHGHAGPWATAKAFIETKWTAATSTAAVGACTKAWAGVFGSNYWFDFDGIQRLRAHCRATSVPDDVARAVDFFVKPVVDYTADARAFDGNGDWDAGDEELFRLFETVEAAAGGGTTITGSDWLGPTAVTVQPAWCAEPASGQSSFRGWKCLLDTAAGYYNVAFVRWNVDGGFVYA